MYDEISKSSELLFQHTAARRRLDRSAAGFGVPCAVSTHSRPKAAGEDYIKLAISKEVSTHSRPKAAGNPCGRASVSSPCFNTQPPEGGWAGGADIAFFVHLFQHTAARRRLAISPTSSAPSCCFNTQPPEGGWSHPRPRPLDSKLFQHTAARRRLDGGI